MGSAIERRREKFGIPPMMNQETTKGLLEARRRHSYPAELQKREGLRRSRFQFDRALGHVREEKATWEDIELVLRNRLVFGVRVERFVLKRAMDNAFANS